jgi:hypothetical protein
MDRVVRLTLILMWGLVVGTATATLALTGGANVSRAVLTGLGGFATSELLLLALLGYLSSSRPTDATAVESAARFCQMTNPGWRPHVCGDCPTQHLGQSQERSRARARSTSSSPSRWR